MGRSAALVAVVLLVGGVFAWCLLRPAATSSSGTTTKGAPLPDAHGPPAVPFFTSSTPGPQGRSELIINDWLSFTRRVSS